MKIVPLSGCFCIRQVLYTQSVYTTLPFPLTEKQNEKSHKQNRILNRLHPHLDTGK